MSKFAHLNVKSNSNPTHGKEILFKTISELLKTGTQHRTHQSIKLIVWKASWWNFWNSQEKNECISEMKETELFYGQ